MGKPLQQTVLLVDDHASVRTFLMSFLQREGFQVLEAVDGVDALERLRCLGRAVDLLVTDVRMPRMMGTDLAQAVRSDYPHTPVVFISGEHLACEFHDPIRGTVFLPKPFRPQVLRDAIRSLLPAPASVSAAYTNV